MSTVAQGPCLSEEQNAVLNKRRQLWNSGYRPVPVYTREKRPFGTDWTGRARRDPPEAVIECPNNSALNTGILCDGLRAVDIDVDDCARAAELQQLAMRMLGLAPMRGRTNSAKGLLLYRASEGNPSKRTLKLVS
jgi:hypothetical protein